MRRRAAIVAISLIAMFAAPLGMSAANAAPARTQANSICLGGVEFLGLKPICLAPLF